MSVIAPSPNPPRARVALTLSLLLIALVPWVLFAGSIASGSRSVLFFDENVEQTIAWWQKFARAWCAGYLPLWDADTQGGHTFAGEIQTGVFYPLHWLWAMLFATPSGIARAAIEYFVVLHFSIAGVGMGLLLRRWRLGLVAVAVGALCYALLGPVALRAVTQPNIFYGLAWLPWVMWVATRYVDEGRGRDVALTGALIGLQIVSGHIQPAFHTALLVATLWIARFWSKEPGWLSLAKQLARAAVWALPMLILIAGAQLLLSLEYAHDAYRWVGLDHPLSPGRRISYTIFGRTNVMDPDAWATLIDPWRHDAPDNNRLYFGFLPLLLAIWWFTAPRARASVEAWRVHGAWLIGIGVFSIVAMVGHYTFVSSLLRVLPMVSQVRQLARYSILFHFVACALVAFAVQALRQGARLPRGPIVLWVLIGIELAWLAHVEQPLMGHIAAWQAAIAAAGWLAMSNARARVKWVAPVVIACVLLHAHAFRVLVALKVTPPHRADAQLDAGAITQYLQPAYGRYRVLVMDDTGLANNYGMTARVQTRRSYGATMWKPFYDLLDADWSEGSRANDLLNIRWVVSRASLDLPVVMRDERLGLTLYERARWLPRVFMSDQLDWPGERIEQALQLRVEHYEDHEQVFSIVAPADGTAVVSEAAYPGWCARVNDVATPITPFALPGRAPWARAVPVRAGRNVIAFSYRPFAARLGACAD